ncbi:RNA polymerase sigma factor [Paenibacillus sp. PAMC21692]|nr:RNA polymerase sigma factor [Paenibacillus sp. PAMC21692]
MEDDYLVTITSLGPAEMELLIVKYWNDIWNYAFVLTKKHDMADDLAQETFVNAFLALNKFRGQSTVKTWLLKICHNLAINHRRSAFFRKVLPVPFVRFSEESPSAEAVYFARSRLDEVWSVLLTLPLKHREVLILEVRYGLSIADIANLLCIAEGTVKSRLHRARIKMRNKMLEE